MKQRKPRASPRRSELRRRFAVSWRNPAWFSTRPLQRCGIAALRSAAQSCKEAEAVCLRLGADPGDNLQESLRRADEAAKHFCTNVARRAHAEARPQKLRFEKLQPPLKQGELLERLPELAVLATVICYRNSCCIHCPDTARQVQQTPMPALLLFREPGPLGNWKPPASPTPSA